MFHFSDICDRQLSICCYAYVATILLCNYQIVVTDKPFTHMCSFVTRDYSILKCDLCNIFGICGRCYTHVTIVTHMRACYFYVTVLCACDYCYTYVTVTLFCNSCYLYVTMLLLFVRYYTLYACDRYYINDHL